MKMNTHDALRQGQMDVIIQRRHQQDQVECRVIIERPAVGGLLHKQNYEKRPPSFYIPSSPQEKKKSGIGDGRVGRKDPIMNSIQE